MHDSWSELHPDLLNAIAKCADNYDDYVRLRAVCKGWNLKLPKFPTHIKNPWLALVCPDGHPFYSIGDRVYTFNSPEMHNKVIKGSYDGWLVTVGADAEIEMLNPFTKDQISLPPMSTLPNVIAYHPEKHNEEYTITDRLSRIGADFPLVMSKSQMQNGYFMKFVISSSPQEQGIMAMIIYGICRRLAYCKLGDKKWTGVGTDPVPGYRDALFYGGMIYAVNAVQLLEIDIESGEVIKVQLPHAVNINPRIHFLYVVGTPDGSIMVIIRRMDYSNRDYRHGKTRGFDIYKKLNDKEGKWSSVNNLGDYLLMLGYDNTSVYAASCFSRWKEKLYLLHG